VHRRASGLAKLARDRPAAGWSPADHVGQHCLASERRTGNAVPHVGRYQVPDGIFSLAYYWFYFDDRDRLVDADWQYSSD